VSRRIVGTAVLGGIVTTVEDSPRPLRRVLVTLSGTGLAGSIQAITDDAGRFAFQQLAAGRYTLTAEKPAYVKTYFGSRRPGRGPSRPVALADGQRLTNLAIGIMRGAAVEGTILDEHGVPLSSAQVGVQQRTFVNGEPRLVNPPVRVQLATSDDRGRYRLYGLLPGEYLVRSAGGGSRAAGARVNSPGEIEEALRAQTSGRSESKTSAPGGPVTRSVAYFPEGADPSRAELITLAAGEERTGVDIVSRLVRSSRIDGLAIGPSGQPLTDVMVGIANVSGGTLWGSPGLVRPDADGRFSLASLTPGRYLFFGRASEGSGPASSTAHLPLWTSTEVLVNEEEVVDAILKFLPGVTVSGRMALQGLQPQLDPTALSLSLNALPAIAGASVSMPPVAPGADGAFVFSGVAPGRYRLRVTGPAPWALRSATVAGRDVLDIPLEVLPGRAITELHVTLTNRPSELSGMLYDHLERPAPEYAIVMFSTDRAHWLQSPRRMSGVVKVGSDGRYVVRGLPAGEYFLTALSDLDPSQLSDPAVLELLATASMRITLAEGERKVQDLKLPEAR
jgi:protocatechuate 3,4-dioxygenase beta subunit